MAGMTLYVSTAVVMDEDDMDAIRVLNNRTFVLSTGNFSVTASLDSRPGYLATTLRRVAAQLDGAADYRPAVSWFDPDEEL